MDRQPNKDHSPHTFSVRKSLLATLALFVAMGLLGVVLATYHQEFSWRGYLSMAFFYCVMFSMGLAARSNCRESLGDMLLAGRSLPLSIALLTMTATWVGGGFVNGTAEYVAGSGPRLGAGAVGLRVEFDSGWPNLRWSHAAAQLYHDARSPG